MKNGNNPEFTHTAFKDERFLDYLSFLLNNLSGKNIISSCGIREMLNMLIPWRMNYGIRSFLLSQERRLNISNPKDVIDLLYNGFTRRRIDDELFDWIDEKNPRTCLFVWRRIHYINFVQYDVTRQDCQPVFSEWIFSKIPYTVSKTIHDLKIHNEISNSSSIRTSVIRYFDRLNIDKSAKEHLLLYIKSSYSNPSNNKRLHQWFDTQNREQVEWTVSYMRETLYYYPLVSCAPSSNTRLMLDDIQSFWDILFSENIDKYKYALSSMKKAWSQKKFRDKNVSKKQFSINMSVDIMPILNELVSMYEIRTNKNELIESLIRKEYESMKAKHRI